MAESGTPHPLTYTLQMHVKEVNSLSCPANAEGPFTRCEYTIVVKSWMKEKDPNQVETVRLGSCKEEENFDAKDIEVFKEQEIAKEDKINYY